MLPAGRGGSKKVMSPHQVHVQKLRELALPAPSLPTSASLLALVLLLTWLRTAFVLCPHRCPPRGSASQHQHPVHPGLSRRSPVNGQWPCPGQQDVGVNWPLAGEVGARWPLKNSQFLNNNNNNSIRKTVASGIGHSPSSFLVLGCDLFNYSSHFGTKRKQG